MLFTWMTTVAALGAAALTVRAQEVSPNDNGRLLWDAFFPRVEVPSIRLGTILETTEQRYVSDRREWNQGGRLIPFLTPSANELEMVPIEAYFTMGEYEMQRLGEGARGNEAIMREQLSVDIPARIRALAMANYRRIEVDAFTSWALGTLTARNPETGHTDTFSFPISAGRRQVAGVAWDNTTAYNNFLAWYRDAVDANGGNGIGIMSRGNPIAAIQASAPNPYVPAGSNILPTREQLRQRIQDDLGMPFQFYQNERTVRTFSDAGPNSAATTKLWPAGIIAVVPQNERVGSTAFAPIVRAWSIARSIPEARIDVNGMAAFPEQKDNGKTLQVEVQVNALPVPDQEVIQTMDTGIA